MKRSLKKLVVSGDLTGLRGDLTGLRGDLTGVSGDLSECGLSEPERQVGVDVEKLIMQ